MSYLYRKRHYAVKICDNREIVHWQYTRGKHPTEEPYADLIVQEENKMKRALCPYVVEISKPDEPTHAFFEFIEQETTGLWFWFYDGIFYFEDIIDATAFKLRF